MENASYILIFFPFKGEKNVHLHRFFLTYNDKGNWLKNYFHYNTITKD